MAPSQCKVCLWRCGMVFGAVWRHSFLLKGSMVCILQCRAVCVRCCGVCSNLWVLWRHASCSRCQCLWLVRACTMLEPVCVLCGCALPLCTTSFQQASACVVIAADGADMCVHVLVFFLGSSCLVELLVSVGSMSAGCWYAVLATHRRHWSASSPTTHLYI